jgi:hypothetical protein
VQELQYRLQSCYEVARSNLRAKKEKSKKYYDKNTYVPLFAVGEKVLLHDEKIRRGRSAKLSPPLIGPFEIISIDDVKVTLKLPRNKTLKVHANRLAIFWLNCRNGSQTMVRLRVVSGMFDSDSFGCHCAAI